MATKDGFYPGDPLPLFLSADEPEQGIGNDKAVISLRGLMASLLVAVVTATGIAILSDQVTLFAGVTASAGRHIGASAWRRSADADNSVSCNSINRRC
jgi:hypothetical protein